MLEHNKKNETVNKLITYFSEYIKLYENKLKANNLFNEIDERVHKNLSELVYYINNLANYLTSVINVLNQVTR